MGNGNTSGSDIKPEEYSGYIVTLNTLARFFPDTREDVDTYCQTVAQKASEGAEGFRHHTQTYLTYGDFDRISFKGVDRFSRFFDLDDRSKYWLGKHQNIFLYTIQDDPEDDIFIPTRLYPYQKEPSDPGKPMDSDFGFCINDGRLVGDKWEAAEVEWFLYSSLSQLQTEHQNTRLDLQRTKHCYPFFTVTLISFSNDIITRVNDFKVFIKKVRQKLSIQLDSIIRNANLNMKYEFFGSLNTSEMCVIWLTEQYEDVLFLIECLKNIKFNVFIEGQEENPVQKSLFFAFYSVVGRMLANKLMATDEIKTKIQNNKNEKARIDIIAGNQKSTQELWDTIKKEGNEHHLDFFNQSEEAVRIGEQDLSFVIPVDELYDLFCEPHKNKDSSGNPADEGEKVWGLFTIDVIKSEMLGIKVTLMSNLEKNGKLASFSDINVVGCGGVEKTEETSGSTGGNPSIFLTPISFPEELVSGKYILVNQFARLSEELDPNCEKDKDVIRALYQNIRTKMKERFNSHSGSVDTLDMLYTDYLSNIHESYNALWRNDYNYQFKQSLKYLISLMNLDTSNEKLKDDEKKKKDNDKWFWGQFSKTIDNIRQQTVHYSESGRLVVQIPSSHLRYTACGDMMFHSYYGSIKTVLEDAYKRQSNIKDMRQSELLPIITTNSTPFITSALYKAGDECDNLRILQVDLPYTLLFDPTIGFSYLVHEMFHYISPENRNERNKAICNMIINEVICVRYLYQIESGFKRHLYDLIYSYPEEYYKLYKEFFEKEAESIPDSAESVDFVKFFNRCIGGDESAVASNGVMNELHRSLSAFLWKNAEVKKIRDKVLSDIETDSTLYHDNNATWNDAIKSLWKFMRAIPVSSTTIVSEEIRKSVTNVEKMKRNGELNELNLNIREKEGFPRCYEHDSTREILDSIEVGLKYRQFPELFEKILFDHKYSLLNPYHLEVISNNSHVALNITERFIFGLRESTPDMAMVRYCKMDDIDYLVSYARQIHDTGQDLIAQYDILRLFSVLIWLKTAKFEKDPDSKEAFEFESKGETFLRRYLAEYLPQRWKIEKIINLITDAISWFLQFKVAAYSFKRDYLIYVEDIKKLGQSYNIFYPDGNDTKRDSKLEILVETVKKRREEKENRRFGEKEKKNWDKVIKSANEVIDEYNKNSNSPRMPDKGIIKESVIKMMVELNIKEQDYNDNIKQYNKVSFERILEFIQNSARQTTFEEMRSLVNNKQNNGGDGGEKTVETSLKDQSDSHTETNWKIIHQNVEERTSYRIWGMNDLTFKLATVRKRLSTTKKDKSGHESALLEHSQIDDSTGNYPIWYCTMKTGKMLRPKVFDKEKQKDTIESIHTYVKNALQQYLHEHEGDLRDYHEHETVARMTLESPGRDSNFLPWQGSLPSSLPNKDENIKTDISDISLYLFSPTKYLEIRNYILSEKDYIKSGGHVTTSITSTPIIFQYGARHDEYSRYILGNDTEKNVMDETTARKGSMNVYDLDNIISLLPIPMSFVGLKQNCRFLAYDLASPVVKNDSGDYFSLERLQKMLISELYTIEGQKRIKSAVKGEKKKETIPLSTLIDENAFLYRIDMGVEVLNQLKNLTAR